MHTKVNFQLYCDLMMQKNDKMRITLDEKQFGNIQFSTYGFPDLMIRLFAFLAQELPSEIAAKKGRQFSWKLEEQKEDDTYSTLQATSERFQLDDKSVEEFKRIKECKRTFEGKINFDLYLAFFRTLCKQPDDLAKKREWEFERKKAMRKGIKLKNPDMLTETKTELIDHTPFDPLTATGNPGDIIFPPGEDIPDDPYADSSNSEEEGEEEKERVPKKFRVAAPPLKFKFVHDY